MTAGKHSSAHRAPRHSVLALWHLLSLDAPTVAALWTWLIARSVGVPVTAATLASMFLAVWLLYAADRLLDARLLDAEGARSPALHPPLPLELRHHFHHQHRRAFLALMLIASVLLAAMLPALPPPAVRLYLTLGALLTAWFLLIHTRLSSQSRLPKELAVGVFFPAAVFIPTVAARPDLRLALLGPVFLFAGVCSLNCLLVYAWEHPADVSGAHWTTRRILTATDPSTLLCVCLVLIPLLSLATRALGTAWTPPPAPGLACFLAVALLLLLHSHRERFDAVDLRAAADLALLTPLLWLVQRFFA